MHRYATPSPPSFPALRAHFNPPSPLGPPSSFDLDALLGELRATSSKLSLGSFRDYPEASSSCPRFASCTPSHLPENGLLRDNLSTTCSSVGSSLSQKSAFSQCSDAVMAGPAKKGRRRHFRSSPSSSPLYRSTRRSIRPQSPTLTTNRPQSPLASLRTQRPQSPTLRFQRPQSPALGFQRPQSTALSSRRPQSPNFGFQRSQSPRPLSLVSRIPSDSESNLKVRGLEKQVDELKRQISELERLDKDRQLIIATLESENASLRFLHQFRSWNSIGTANRSTASLSSYGKLTPNMRFRCCVHCSIPVLRLT